MRIVIGFTDHIDQHCAALRALFEYPDEFEIIQQPRTAQEVEQIQQDVVAIAGNMLRSAGMGAGTVDVSLRADAERLAEEIRAKYGDLVTIRLGLQGYPAGSAPDPDCAARPLPLVTASPFVATLRLENASVRSGEDFKGTATVTNRSDALVEFESGQPMTAFIYRAGTDQLVGMFDGGIGGTGVGKTMRPASRSTSMSSAARRAASRTSATRSRPVRTTSGRPSISTIARSPRWSSATCSRRRPP